jgi:hypothetical protein
VTSIRDFNTKAGSRQIWRVQRVSNEASVSCKTDRIRRECALEQLIWPRFGEE